MYNILGRKIPTDTIRNTFLILLISAIFIFAYHVGINDGILLVNHKCDMLGKGCLLTNASGTKLTFICPNYLPEYGTPQNTNFSTLNLTLQ